MVCAPSDEEQTKKTSKVRRERGIMRAQLPDGLAGLIEEGIGVLC